MYEDIRFSVRERNTLILIINKVNMMIDVVNEEPMSAWYKNARVTSGSFVVYDMYTGIKSRMGAAHKNENIFQGDWFPPPRSIINPDIPAIMAPDSTVNKKRLIFI